MSIRGYFLIIEEQTRWDGEFEKVFDANLISEHIFVETVKEFKKCGRPIRIRGGAIIVKDEEKAE